MMRSLVSPDFLVKIDHRQCRRCKRCVLNCGFGALSFLDRVTPDNTKCVACQRCVAFCPEGAITVERNPLAFKGNDYWTANDIKSIYKQAEAGGMLLTGMGNDRPYGSYFDRMVLDACQVTNPSIDPLREPMELRTYLGSKPNALEFAGKGRRCGADHQARPPGGPGNPDHLCRHVLRRHQPAGPQSSGPGGLSRRLADEHRGGRPA